MLNGMHEGLSRAYDNRLHKELHRETGMYRHHTRLFRGVLWEISEVKK